MQTLPKANILLVDDHPSNLLALEAMLEDLGQNLIQANSGEEALKCLLENDFAVILLDVQMGGMDGFETATLIKQRPRSQDTPIIFVTAIHRSDIYVFQGYSSGAVDYLFKPVSPEILRAKVSVFVDLYHKQAQLKQQAAEIEAMNRELQHQLAQVNKLNRELESVNQELESFSYSVSHDLRAPLRSIKGFSQAVLENYSDQLDNEGQDYLNRINASCKRMGELIDDLLQLSRVTRGKLQLEPVDLSGIALDITDQLCKSDPTRQVELIAPDELIVEGDARLLRVVLENLLSNAWKFTGKHASARIELGSFKRDGLTVYYVRDDGAGFDMDYAHQLFGAFHRLHADDEFEGNGIGLATVQRIINRHGGQIWAEGAVEQGATFYFTL